jgi:hypothetical protein
MSEVWRTQSRAGSLAIAIVLLDAVAYVFILKSYWFAGPAKTFDIVAGLIVSFFFCMTAIPALILLLLRVQLRAAMLFALGFPLACALTSIIRAAFTRA